MTDAEHARAQREPRVADAPCRRRARRHDRVRQPEEREVRERARSDTSPAWAPSILVCELDTCTISTACARLVRHHSSKSMRAALSLVSVPSFSERL